MTLADDYFSRVRPLLGAGLSPYAIEIDDAELALLVVEMLASCMLETVTVTHVDTLPALARHIEWKQPFQPLRAATREPDARIRARRARAGEGASAQWDAECRVVTMIVDPSDPLGWFDVSYHVARTLRDILLGSVRWPAGAYWYGAAAWPFSPRTAPVAHAQPDYAALRDRHIMVIGCGSVGSEAIRLLDGRGVRWTFVDDATVSVFNLARQWYGADEVGTPKVAALARRVVHAQAWPAQLGSHELAAFEARLLADRPDLVLLATGTHHHGMLGEVLWRHGIPHVAACCYPQARYFEVSVVSPAEATPCLHCFRGHLYSGTPEPAPMTDEVASFLYRPMSEAERARAYTDLVAEPASRIETMRVAHLLAWCAVELCAARPSPWFERVLAAETTCLLGGNTSRPLPDGGYAYGIREPGQVIRLGVGDVAGPGTMLTCGICTRELAVAHCDEVPAIDDVADLALL